MNIVSTFIENYVSCICNIIIPFWLSNRFICDNQEDYDLSQTISDVVIRIPNITSNKKKKINIIVCKIYY